MKFLLVALLVVAAIAPAAAAWPQHEAGGGLIAVQMQRQRPGGVQPRQPPRDFRGPQRPPEQGQRTGGKLTDEERRDLHRDLDRANREIYKGPPR